MVLLLISLLTTWASELPHTNTSFSKAKKLMKKVYVDHQVTFYCGCDYSYIQVKGKETSLVNPASCGYKPRTPVTKKGKQNIRTTRIEWEHVIPAENFGRQFACWRDGATACVKKDGKPYKGRKCCEKVDRKFAIMQADMHNLRPAIGELNGDRSNFRYGMITGEPRAYGRCDFEVDLKERRVEPKEDIRGDIARTYWYFEKEYGMKISDHDRKLLQAWEKSDPADQWERERNKRIGKIQGGVNSFIE